MSEAPVPRTMDLVEAAFCLKMHPDTLQTQGTGRKNPRSKERPRSLGQLREQQPQEGEVMTSITDTWFAWYPVRIGALSTGPYVWLRRVWRNRCMGVTIYQRL